MYLDYDWIDTVDVRVRGEARDEVTDATGATRIVDESSVEFETAGGLLTVAVVTPPEVDESDLVGHPLRAGFRRRLKELHDPGGRPLGLLLDDVSGAMIAAGYVHALDGSLDRSAGGTQRPQPAQTAGPSSALGTQADYCSGWRSDGIMMVSIRAGEPMPFLPVPPVPERPEGSGEWPTPEIPSPGLRRLRRIDVTLQHDEWLIDAWFRDTYRAPDGQMGALHEYTVEARVDPASHALLELTATPHALPWNECPAAAVAVDKLVGLPLDGLRSSVPLTLSGIESCTHLTNELRELADVPLMLARL